MVNNNIQDKVVVIGYSYARGGTEIGLFDLGRDGSLTGYAGGLERKTALLQLEGVL